MIDFGKILKRAWHILWNYRILWIFGFLMAITAGGNVASNSNNTSYRLNARNNNPGINWNSSPILRSLYNWYLQYIQPMVLHPGQYIATFIWIGVGLFLFFLVVGLILAFVRMVDEYESTGVKIGFRKSWKLGWNRRAFRMWFIDLIIIDIPRFLLVGVLGTLAVLALLAVRNGQGAGIAASIIGSICCAILFFVAFFLLAVLLGLLREFFIRKAALENTGIGESFRGGWRMFKRNWKDIALMWLIMFGIWIGAWILGRIVFYLLFPAYLVLSVPGIIVALIPGLAVLGITSIFASGPLAWILGVVAALPFFFLIVLAPLSLVNGWYKIYASSVWTLTYREIQAVENVAPAAPSSVEIVPPLN
jgi:hypothetical protein